MSPLAQSSRRQLLRTGLTVGVIGAATTLGAVTVLTGVGPTEVAGAATTAKKTTTTKKPKPTPITTLKVARMGITRPVFAGVDDSTLTYGPGHAMWTVAPEADGHCLLMGHRSTHGSPFNKLNKLKPGDPVVLGTTTYTVVKWEVLPVTRPKAIWEWEGTGKRLSLIACSKPNGTPTSTAFRICVRCQA